MAMGVPTKNWNQSPAAFIKGKGGKKIDEDKDYTKRYADKIIFTRLLYYLAPYKRNAIFLILCLLITSITQLAYPVGMTVILHIIYPSDTLSGLSQFINEFLFGISEDPFMQLYYIGIILVAALLLNYVVKRVYHYNIQKLSQLIIFDLRREMFHHIQGLSMKFYTDTPAGKLMSRLTNDVSTVQTLISTEIIQAIGDIFNILSSTILMFAMSWKLSLYIMMFAPLFAVVFIIISRRSRVYWFKERRTIAELTGILQESISGSRTIKAFVTENENIDEFSSVNQANRDISLKAARLNALLHPITQLMVACGIGLVMYIGSIFVQEGTLDVGLMLGYVIIAQQFMNPINNLGTLYNNAQHALAAGDRVLSILDTKPDILDDPKASVLPMIQGNIEYDHVSFHYVPDIPVLKDINLKFTPNLRVALVGFTGAGKSTFISLLSRFYDPTEGKILIDNVDIKNITMQSLRSQMGIVLQDTFLFSDTIMENIRFGRNQAADTEVIEAAKKVGADPFIMRLPEGYQTNVGERGGLLSVGQRQLISFARALLANPRILILDEATSSVDPYTELKIQEALEVLLKGRNSFIIAHRLSTILNSDLILVMDKGKIIQSGNHESLLQQGGLYKHLYEMQFKDMDEKQSSKSNQT